MNERRKPPPNPEPFPPFEVESTRRIYDSHWCGLRCDFVRLPGGALQEYHIFEIPSAVTVVPVTPEGRIVLVGQYRYPHGKTHWEVPAGRIDAGEEPLQTARRELLEETGHTARELKSLPGFYPTNGISPHFAHAFVALDCEPTGELQLEASEQIVVKVFERCEVEALLDAGMIQDGFSALPLLYYLRGSGVRSQDNSTT